MATKKIACLYDVTTTPGHAGFINTSGQVGPKFVNVAAGQVAVLGATFFCTTIGHGVTPITPITVRSFAAGGKLIITEGAVAGCGAVIAPLERRVHVE